MKQIEIAARWWKNIIADGAKHDNGDTGTASMFAAVMTKSNMEPTTKEQLDTFECELIRLFENEPDAERWGLHCDYNPNQMLADAAKVARIPEANFPWKTNMQFRDGKIMVSYGYGAEWEEVTDE